ncbi:MAG TPA: hypothetical protein VMG81_07545 [Thermoplasmata archaeon]|nr:hypothetical protein [Thermoplasmata archaeon]
MPSPTATKIQCNTCGTTFSSADPAAAQAHLGHDLEHIQQG